MKNKACPERSRGGFTLISGACKGFTLIEMMVSIGILGIIATMGTNLLFSVLGGSAKAKVLQSVKQNGGYAMSVMETMIRNARKIDSYSGSSLTIVNPDGGTTLFSCNNRHIASNSGSLMNDEVSVTDCASFFTVTKGVAGVRPDMVEIQFKLIQSGTSSRPEQQAAVEFQTTIGLRNY